MTIHIKRRYTMKHIYRSATNKKIAGICGGIGEMTDTDPTIIRLGFVVLGLATGFFPFFVGYILAWMIVPIGVQN
jgi:phage shock protein C